MKPNDLTMGMDQEDAPEASETGIPDAEDTAEAPEAAPIEVAVPLASLAIPDEQENMAAPEVGDKGQAPMEYTVTRIEGENAFITLDAVNGQKLGTEKTPTDDDETGQLQQMAAGMPDRA